MLRGGGLCSMGGQSGCVRTHNTYCWISTPTGVVIECMTLSVCLLPYKGRQVVVRGCIVVLV